MYFLDNKQIDENELDDLLYDEAEYMAAETGIEMELSHHCITQTEYEIAIDNIYDKLKCELTSNGKLYTMEGMVVKGEDKDGN